MRKILILPYPFAVIFLLFVTFSLLDLRSDHRSVLGIKKTAATTVPLASPLAPKAPSTPSFPGLTVKATSTPTPQPKASIQKADGAFGPDRSLDETPTSVPAPTRKPSVTPSATPIPASPQSSSQVPAGDPILDYLIQKINEYRASQGLTGVKTDSYTCGFAAIRAEEISHSFNHDGFSSRISSQTLPYPTYHKITENIAMTSDYKQVVTMWINSSGHAENMRQDTPNVCIARFGSYYAYEGWRP